MVDGVKRRRRGESRGFTMVVGVRVGVEGASADLPQQRAVNQSDLGWTGTHLFRLDCSSPTLATAGDDGGRREKACVTRISLGRKDTKRWIDGPRMKRLHENKVNGGGTAEKKVAGTMSGKATINGLM